jgi:hypothetical protein
MLKIAIAPIVVLLAHILATVFGWYENNWWFDIPMHFAGGIATAISSYYFLEDFSDRQKFHTQFKPLQILIIIALVALAAVVWEMMEFTFDTIAGTNLQPSLPDTVKDLTVGMTSGILTTLAIVWRKK